MRTSFNALFLVLLTFLLVACARPTDKQPYGLMTDLIERTDLTWQNGHPSDYALNQIDPGCDSIQYAAIRSTHPMFSWIVPGKANNTHQISYHVVVSDNMDDAAARRGNVWNSGEVCSNRSVAVPYGGDALSPATVYYWQVRCVTDTEGESDWSAIRSFRTADSLSEYQTAYYPQVKTLEYPESVKRLDNGVYLADFGKDAFAQPLLTLSSESGADSVIVRLGECMKNGRIQQDNGISSIRYQRYVLALRQGTHTYRIDLRKDKRNTGPAAVLMPSYIGEVLPYRYCEVEGYEPELTCQSISREAVHYPFNDSAADFTCSNDTLNMIWELCKYSIKATSFAGLYVDGDRERIPYEADALINQLSHYGVDKEYSIARHTIGYLLDHPTWPTEWILQALSLAWYDYLYTGDYHFIASAYETLKARSLLQLSEENGLISTTTGLQTPEFLESIQFNGFIRDIVDWPHTGILGLGGGQGGEDDGFVYTDYNVVTNAWHCQALRYMGRFAAVLGKEDEAAWFDAQAGIFKERFMALFYDVDTGLFTDGLTTQTNHASLHGNMFPLVFGMVDADAWQPIIDFLHTRGMACSVYGSQFLLDALYQVNDASYALGMLTKTDDRGWYNMIRVGSTITLEAWDNKYKPNQDWNHAWGSAPANIIPRRLMGVQPITPGCDTICVKPQVASLSNAKAKIPFIRGNVLLEVENTDDAFTLRLTVPANMDAEVYLPSFNGWSKVTRNGKPLGVTPVEGEPFLYAGIYGSGTYFFKVR